MRKVDGRMDAFRVGGDHTQLRHSREGGNPVWGRPTHALDSRLRGNGKVMKCRSSPSGRLPIFVIQDSMCDYSRDIRRPPSSLRVAVLRSNRKPSTIQGDSKRLLLSTHKAPVPTPTGE